jgi:hypothetical protein
MPTTVDAFVPDHAAYSVRWVIGIGKTIILGGLCVMSSPKSGNGQDAKTEIALRFKLGVLLRWPPVASNSRDGKNLSFRLGFLAKTSHGGSAPKKIHFLTHWRTKYAV